MKREKQMSIHINREKLRIGYNTQEKAVNGERR